MQFRSAKEPDKIVDNEIIGGSERKTVGIDEISVVALQANLLFANSLSCYRWPSGSEHVSLMKSLKTAGVKYTVEMQEPETLGIHTPAARHFDAGKEWRVQPQKCWTKDSNQQMCNSRIKRITETETFFQT